MLPVDVACLVEIHNNHQPDEDLVYAPVQEILEHYGVVAEVKGLSVVQQASKHRRSSIHKTSPKRAIRSGS